MEYYKKRDKPLEFPKKNEISRGSIRTELSEKLGIKKSNDEELANHCQTGSYRCRPSCFELL